MEGNRMMAVQLFRGEVYKIENAIMKEELKVNFSKIEWRNLKEGLSKY